MKAQARQRSYKERILLNKQTKTENGLPLTTMDLVTGTNQLFRPNQKRTAVTRFVTLQDSQEVEVAPTVEDTQAAPTFYR